MNCLVDRLPYDGHYAKKQIRCRNKLISWSHRSRFEFARRLVAPHARKRLLDYGCGDGTFLALIRNEFPEAVGADVDPHQISDCEKRFRQTNLSFVLTHELCDERHTAKYDVVVCMEVLEHCVPRKCDEALANLRRLVTPDATIIISVPIEIGPSLLAKQIARTFAGWQGCGDYRYREKYTFGELCKMIFAGRGMGIHRPVYQERFISGQPNVFHGHKGFNWKTLHQQVEDRFHVRQFRCTPLPWLSWSLNSQVWLICQPK